jgi:hypothetical protein
MSKKIVQYRTSDDLIGSHPLKNIVKGWFFRVDEVSMGHYLVEGVDHWGRMVSREGSDPDKLLTACKEDALELISNLSEQGH